MAPRHDGGGAGPRRRWVTKRGALGHFGTGVACAPTPFVTRFDSRRTPATPNRPGAAAIHVRWRHPIKTAPPRTAPCRDTVQSGEHARLSKKRKERRGPRDQDRHRGRGNKDGETG